jgi:hypothetical protein
LGLKSRDATNVSGRWHTVGMAETVGDHERASAWTEEALEQWHNYADQVTVEVRFKEWIGAKDEGEF